MKRTKSDYDKKWNKEEVQGRKIAKIYDYRDEQGELLFEAIRYEPKAFRQRRPDFKGGYIWDLKDTRRVLYRLPELIKGKDPVFVCEGEKDVDNLREWGLTATCCPMGAEKWKSQQKEYNPFLKGREVIIIPDNDPEGERHLAQVASCLQGSAGNVKVLRLPAAKDFSDWKEKDKDNTEEKFLTLLSEAEEFNNTPPVIKSEEEQPKHKAISLTDFLKQTPEEIPCLIGKGLLPKQGYLMIAGKAKEGKTKMALMFTLCLATALPIFFKEDDLTGMFPIPEKVRALYLYREAEGLIGITLKKQITGLENLFKIKISQEDRDRICLKYPPKELYLDMTPGRIVFENIIKANPVDLVVIDPLSKFVARDMNKMPPVIATANLLEDIGRDYDCSFILIHHLNKEPTLDPFDSITGSSAWRNSYSSGLMLQRRYEGRSDMFKRVTFEFRNAETPDFITTKRDPETSLFFEVTEEEALRGASNVERLVKMIEDNFREPVTYTKITNLAREKWGVTKARIARLLSDAVKQQLLEKTGSERDTRYTMKTQKDLAL